MILLTAKGAHFSVRGRNVNKNI